MRFQGESVDVLAVVPYADRGAGRRRAFQLVLGHLSARYPTLVVPLGDGLPASAIAAARNDGVWLGDAHVYLFNDADSLVPHAQIERALELALAADGPVWAFDNYQRLSERATLDLGDASAAFTAPVSWEIFSSWSAGCLAMSSETCELLAGFDEDYSFGFEDYDLRQRAVGLGLPIRRVPGDLIHLWHERPAVEPETSEHDRRRALGAPVG